MNRSQLMKVFQNHMTQDIAVSALVFNSPNFLMTDYKSLNSGFVISYFTRCSYLCYVFLHTFSLQGTMYFLANMLAEFNAAILKIGYFSQIA
jgi:hypothetical protein